MCTRDTAEVITRKWLYDDVADATADDDDDEEEHKEEGIIFANNQLDAQFFFMYIYFCSLHVSGSRVPIIRRINCINVISGICHYV